MTKSIELLLKEAAVAFKALPPEEQQKMTDAQRESWIRGEMGMRETSVVAKPTSDDLVTQRAETNQITARLEYLISDNLYAGPETAKDALAEITRLRAELAETKQHGADLEMLVEGWRLAAEQAESDLAELRAQRDASDAVIEARDD